MNEYNKTKTDSQTQRTNCGYQLGERRGKRQDKTKGKEAQTTRYKTNTLQGYIIQYKQYSQCFIITLNAVKS